LQEFRKSGAAAMRLFTGIAAFLLPTIASAHPEASHVSGFLDGAAHPVGGVDHLLAMLAIGLWMVQSRGLARLALPAAFLGGMLAGGALALANIVIPAFEPMIVASVILLGVLIAIGLQVSLRLACVGLVIFGLAHGAAHGVEANKGGLLYVVGFLFITAMLHGLGYGLGMGFRAFDAPRFGRVLAGLIVLFGAALALN
jgi:urease accessory protein